jgi:hypothetical protein
MVCWASMCGNPSMIKFLDDKYGILCASLVSASFGPAPLILSVVFPQFAFLSVRFGSYSHSGREHSAHSLAYTHTVLGTGPVHEHVVEDQRAKGERGASLSRCVRVCCSERSEGARARQYRGAGTHCSGRRRHECLRVDHLEQRELRCPPPSCGLHCRYYQSIS